MQVKQLLPYYVLNVQVIRNPFKEVCMSTDINRWKYSIVIWIQTAAVYGAPDWAFALVQGLHLLFSWRNKTEGSSKKVK